MAAATTIVSCVSWVRRGVSKQVPDQVQLESEDLEEMLKVKTASDDEIEDDEERPRKVPTQSNRTVDDEGDVDREDKENEAEDEEEGEHVKQMKADCDPIDPDDDPYNLAAYDDEDATTAHGLNLANLVMYSDDKDDPLVTMHDDDEVDLEEEKAAFEILPTDNLILAGRAAPDCSILEVYVFNEDDGDLYCHHDITIPAFPLATQWLNFDPETQQRGNLVAVGSMEPHISIWDLDVVNLLEPVCILGEKPTKGFKKKKKSASSSSGLTGHTAAVLDLSWNSLAPAALASASADFTAGLWDLNKKEQVLSLQHDEKVQSLNFHPKESSVLLTGAFDHYVRLFDCRQPDKSPLLWKLNGEVERVLWDEFSPFNFLASTEAGHIFYMDSRKDKKPLFTLNAHESAVTGLTQISAFPHSLVTVGMDSTVKVWDLIDHKPACVYSKEFNESHYGGVTCVKSCPDSSTILVLGTEKRLTTWDVSESAAVVKHFTKGQQGQDMNQSFTGLSKKLYELSMATPVEEEDEELREYIDGIEDELLADSKEHNSRKKGDRPQKRNERPPKNNNRSSKRSDRPLKNNDRSSKKSDRPPKQNGRPAGELEQTNFIPLGQPKAETNSKQAVRLEVTPSSKHDEKREVKKAKRRLKREKNRQKAADAEAEELFARS